MPIINTKGPRAGKGEGANLMASAFCKDTCKVAHICRKCGVFAYCNLGCHRFDWHRHKFSCNFGRLIDSTGQMVLACRTNEFPPEDHVAKQYGFMCFVSGSNRWRLFELYRRLVIDWDIDEEELRSALELNRLKEVLTIRCLQTGDPIILGVMQWLESEEEFGANGEDPGTTALFDVAREELLSPEERKESIFELQPP